MAVGEITYGVIASPPGRVAVPSGVVTVTVIGPIGCPLNVKTVTSSSVAVALSIIVMLSPTVTAVAVARLTPVITMCELELWRSSWPPSSLTTEVMSGAACGRASPEGAGPEGSAGGAPGSSGSGGESPG